MLWKKISEKISERNWTVYKLCLKAGIGPAGIYRLRDGEVKDLYFDTVKKIADALEVSLDEFRLEVKIIWLMQMLMLYMKFMQIILMMLSMQKIKSLPTRLTMKKYVSILKQVSGDV